MMDKVNIFNSSDELILSVYPDDTSYRYKAIMGENSLTLKFSLDTFVEFEVDSYIDYKAERYFLWDAGNIVKENTRNFDYTLQLQTYAALLGTKQFKFFTVDGLGNPIPPYKIKGSYSGTPQDFLTLIVRNMNDGDSGWTVGSYIVGEAKLMSFNQLTCSEFLTQVANEYKTEWEIVGKTISLGKVEKDKESPVPLSYGFGNGFKSGVKRENGDTSQINRLLVQGGSTNIDKSKYRIYNMVGSDILLLPANATKIYNGVTYETDAFGTYVQRAGLTGRIREGSYENVDIYPQRVGTVSSVVTVDAVEHFYDIVDSSIPEALDYNAAMITGEVRTIIFQTGALSGQEFDIQNYYHAADDTHAARTFEIVPKEDAGTALPSGTLIPAVGDKYIIYHISMPQTYIDTAEQGLLDKAVEVLYENEQGTFTFTGELDGIYAKTNWLTIGSKLNCGYFVSFTDAQFQTDPVLIRIVGVREYLNKPYEPVLELTNNVQAKTLASTLRDRDADEVRIDNSYVNSLAYTKRRWRDAKETMKLLQDAFDNFGAGINPIWVQTMSLLVGDESLQYRFVNFIPLVSTDPEPITVNDTFIYNNGTKTFSNQIGHIQHMTIGITSISPSHSKLEYKYWNIPAFSYVFTDTDAYYVYLKCSKTTQEGIVFLSKTAYKLDPNDGYYYFLVGTLSSEVEGERSFVTLYGFTEILPGRITVDKILSPDGIQYWDMLSNKFKIGNETRYLSYNENNDNVLKLVGTIEATDGHIAGWSILTDSIKKGNVVLGADGSISSVSGATTFWTLNADGSGSVGSGGLSWDTQGNIIGNFVELYNDGDFNVAGNIFATGSIVAGATNGIAPDDLPVATSSLYGVVKFDAATLGLNGSGQLTVIGGGWSNVSWGTPTSQYTPLTINSVTRNLSVDGHTHSYLPLSGGRVEGDLFLGTISSPRTLVVNYVEGENSTNLNLNRYGGQVLINNQTAWHAGNDGAGSGLDADLLDGKHNGEITAAYFAPKMLSSANTLDNISDGVWFYVNGNNPTNSVGDNSALLQIGSRWWDIFQLAFPGNNSNSLHFRSSKYESESSRNWNSWKTIAFTDSNVASATKLANTRTIWGQPFNGEGDVDGTLAVTNIGNPIIKLNSTFNTENNRNWDILTNATAWGRFDIRVSPSYNTAPSISTVTIKNNGNVGIGAINPLYNLDVNGTFRTTGAAYLNSTLSVTGASTFTGLLTANGGINATAGAFSSYVAANRIYTGYDSGQANSISCSNWFRSNGASGWYNDTYGAGIHSDTANIVRTYSTNKFKVYNTAIDSILTLGGVTAANVVSSGAVVAGALNGTLPNDLPVATSAVFGVVKTGASINNNAGVVNLNGRHYTTTSAYTDSAVREITAEIALGTGSMANGTLDQIQLSFAPLTTTRGLTANVIATNTGAGMGLKLSFRKDSGTGRWYLMVYNDSGAAITRDGILLSIRGQQTI